jgi:hypothetical protein
VPLKKEYLVKKTFKHLPVGITLELGSLQIGCRRSNIVIGADQDIPKSSSWRELKNTNGLFKPINAELELFPHDALISRESGIFPNGNWVYWVTTVGCDGEIVVLLPGKHADELLLAAGLDPLLFQFKNAVFACLRVVHAIRLNLHLVLPNADYIGPAKK